MRLSLAVTKQISCQCDKRFFRRVVAETLSRSGVPTLQGATVSVSIACVSQDEIQELNKTYRQKNRSTDVLSFGHFQRKMDVRPDGEGMIELGDLVISPEFIARAAQEDEVSFPVEMAYIVSHGVLHLLGFRHSPKMFAIQDAVTAAYFDTQKL